MIKSIQLEPIGYFRSHITRSYEAPRQGVLVNPDQLGFITLRKNSNFEQALDDLDGFDRIWLIYIFDRALDPERNPRWKPKVLPPRGAHQKRGVFATRSPYRPNPIGLSAVRLLERNALTLKVAEVDLLDGTPILDIKPYLSYADAFADATLGWTTGLNEHRTYAIHFSSLSETQLSWLETRGLKALRDFIVYQLQEDPTDRKRKRVTQITENQWLLAYQTWRVEFQIDPSQLALQVLSLRSGYSSEQLHGSEDTHLDKTLHREFCKVFKY